MKAEWFRKKNLEVGIKSELLKMYGHQGGKVGVGGWDELGDWDGHIYTNLYKIDN